MSCFYRRKLGLGEVRGSGQLSQKLPSEAQLLDFQSSMLLSYFKQSEGFIMENYLDSIFQFHTISPKTPKSRITV